MTGMGIIGFLLVAPVEAQELPCLTPTLMQQWGDKPKMQAYPERPPLPGKGERDAWGEWPNDAYSENFVVKWGTDNISSNTINGVLDAFESAWSVQVEERDFQAPVGSKDYRFNVYIAESGQNTLSSHGAAGYFSYDSEGWPLIVLAKASLGAEDGGAGTVVHEFFHAVQDAEETWEYTGLGGWYYEATACWSVPEVLPGDLTYMAFIMGFALLPNYSVNFFDYWDTGAFPEYHQYGAFLFPRYLSEHVMDWRLIRDSWREDNSANDPLKAIEALLQEGGEDLDQVFSDFGAHNAIWDYSDGEHYRYYVDYYAGQFPQWDCRISDSLGRSGDDDWREANTDCLPQSYGYNLVEIDRPKSGHVSLSFKGEETGSRATAATWMLQLVRDGGSKPTYNPVDFEGHEADAVFCDVGEEDALYLVISSHGQRFKEDETFDYSYKLEIVDSHPECGGEPVDTGEPEPADTGTVPVDPRPGDLGGFGGLEARGCNCKSAVPRTVPGTALLLGLVGLVGLRARRA